MTDTKNASYGWEHPLAPPTHLGEFEESTEHGAKWLTCIACGAQWSIQGSELEEVSAGDQYCEAAIQRRDEKEPDWDNNNKLSPEGAAELLYEAGKEAKREGADMEHSANFFETMLGYADPEYVEAAKIMGDEALECFQRGLV